MIVILAYLNQKWCWEDISLSYVRFFAEFLEDLSLVHLGLLAPPTCVGFRYGSRIFNLGVFPGKPLGRILPRRAILSARECRGLTPVFRIFLENHSLRKQSKSNNGLLLISSVTPSKYAEVQ